jgi:hypothetical protein
VRVSGKVGLYHYELLLGDNATSGLVVKGRINNDSPTALCNMMIYNSARDWSNVDNRDDCDRYFDAASDASFMAIAAAIFGACGSIWACDSAISEANPRLQPYLRPSFPPSPPPGPRFSVPCLPLPDGRLGVAAQALLLGETPYSRPDLLLHRDNHRAPLCLRLRQPAPRDSQLFSQARLRERDRPAAWGGLGPRHGVHLWGPYPRDSLPRILVRAPPLPPSRGNVGGVSPSLSWVGGRRGSGFTSRAPPASCTAWRGSHSATRGPTTRPPRWGVRTRSSPCRCWMTCMQPSGRWGFRMGSRRRRFWRSDPPLAYSNRLPACLLWLRPPVARPAEGRWWAGGAPGSDLRRLPWEVWEEDVSDSAERERAASVPNYNAGGLETSLLVQEH